MSSNLFLRMLLNGYNISHCVDKVSFNYFISFYKPSRLFLFFAIISITKMTSRILHLCASLVISLG